MQDFHSSDEYDRRGFELCESGDYEGALSVYREGLSIFPFTPELHSGKAHSLLYQGEFVGALSAFTHGLSLSPLDPDLNKGAALALLYLNRPVQAHIHIQRALPYFADDENAVFELAYGFYQVACHEDAAVFFRRALALHPDHVDSLLYLGLCLHQVDTPDTGEKYRALEKARDLDPDRPDLCEHFAHILYEDGRKEEAFTMFETLRVEDIADPSTLERMMEACRLQAGMRRKRSALRRRLKEIRDVDEVEELLEDLRMEWGPEPGV